MTNLFFSSLPSRTRTRDTKKKGITNLHFVRMRTHNKDVVLLLLDCVLFLFPVVVVRVFFCACASLRKIQLYCVCVCVCFVQKYEMKKSKKVFSIFGFERRGKALEKGLTITK